MTFSLGDAKLILDGLRKIDEIHDQIGLLTAAVLSIGADVATAAEQISALSTKVDGLAATAVDIHADFTAFKDAMEAERENLTAAGQAALDTANAKTDAAGATLADLDVAVGDADGSDTPAPPVEPEQFA